MADRPRNVAARPEEVHAPAHRAVLDIVDGFDDQRRRFRGMTRRAAARHADRDWHGVLADVLERLDVYESSVNRTVTGRCDSSGGGVETVSRAVVVPEARRRAPT